MVEKIEPGEYRNIDKYVSELEETGYTVSYENIVSDATGFIAELYVNGELHAVWIGGEDVGGQMVRSVEKELSEIGSPDKIEALNWFLRGFSMSREGYNAEYPFADSRSDEELKEHENYPSLEKRFESLWETFN